MTESNVDTFEMSDFNGCIGNFNNRSIQYLNSHPEVNYIEETKEVEMYAVQNNPANWGLTRISHRKPLFANGNNSYVYSSIAGKGTTVYVIDSGVNPTSEEFGNRARILKNYVNNVKYDENGHGTHVSGIIGSKSFGVAKNAEILVMKVFDARGRGASSDVILRAIVDSVAHSKQTGRTAVINMSLGAPRSRAMNDAVMHASKSGLPVIVAAGNEGKDACTVSPASSEYAITVGNINKRDQLAKSSNFGRCVNINAPGTDIISTYKQGTKSLSGTSMASPHVAGIIAMYLANNVYKDVNQITKHLSDSSDPALSISSKGVTKKVAFNRDLFG